MTPTAMPRSIPEAARYGRNRLFRDATSLASSSLVNAVFGMGSMALTAHLVPPVRLGVYSAVLSAIMTPALAAATAVGNAYASLLPAVGRARPRVFRHGQRVFRISTTVGGVISGIAAISAISAVRGSLPVFLLVLCGTLLFGEYNLQGSTLTAIGRANWFVGSAVGMNALKLILLPAFALTFEWHCVELSTVIAAGFVAMVLRPLIVRAIDRGATDGPPVNLPEREAVREFNRFASRSFVVVALSNSVFSFTPFLVTTFSIPKEGALFALSLTVVQALDLIATAMGTSLSVHGSAVPCAAAAMARSVLVRALLVSTSGAVVVVVAAPVLLRLLNAEYGTMNATAVVAVMSAGTVVRTGFMVWAALQRSRRNMRPLVVVSACGAVAVVVAMPILARSHGALGGAYGLAMAYVVLTVGAAVHTFYVWRSSKNRPASSAGDPAQTCACGSPVGHQCPAL
jgi:O-antigen/teichoic acid export membrane protein